MAPRIDLNSTFALHDRLLGRWRDDPKSCQAACDHASQTLSDRETKFEGARSMNFALSALLLKQQHVETLREIGESLHRIAEKAMDWVLSDHDRFIQFFRDHERMWPWLRKASHSPHWQGVSRFDAVITADGQVRILELNTGCPAGFFHAENFSDVTARAMVEAGAIPAHAATSRYGTIPERTLCDELLEIERQGTHEQGLIALVNDENELQNELALFQRKLRSRGRRAEIVNARDIQWNGSQATVHGEPISLAYNKIRISTPNSPGHHWRPGFENRYAGYLEAIAKDGVVAVNNLACLTVGEDKGLLEVMRTPEFTRQLSDAERLVVEHHVLRTVRLREGLVDWDGQTIDLLPFVQRNRERLVIKPANEGRGFGVVVGKFATPSEWEAACELDPCLPKVVQEFTEPASLEVQRDANHESMSHFLTVGLAMIRGRYSGLLSRVSTNPVTNVGRDGVVQAVFVEN
ncbi:glutathionylspermidine synthase family protein [Thalassoroseus pseudoceratinae]|uniref:glutathionylspermidine synthase family protein n=1 Tax=Thalassoroseus pseudoceratinae TaxID=2713176 RepID=UPI001424867E|nr:glutathionylspermidine synthase family protein [Thalassoroseus pseudoceratinae]